jgi:hypothetical protein
MLDDGLPCSGETSARMIALVVLIAEICINDDYSRKNL